MIPFTCNFCTIICTHSLLLSLLSLLTFPYPYQPFSGSQIPFAFSPPSHFRDFFPWSSIAWTCHALSYNHLSSHWCFSSPFAWWSHFSVVNTWASCVSQCFAMVPHHHEQWQNFSYVAYHSHCLSLSLPWVRLYFSLFSCMGELPIKCQVKTCVSLCLQQRTLLFPLSPHHVFSCCLSASQYELSVMMSLSYCHCHSLTVFIHCVSPDPIFVDMLCCCSPNPSCCESLHLCFFSLPSCAHILRLYICTATMARN